MKLSKTLTILSIALLSLTGCTATNTSEPSGENNAKPTAEGNNTNSQIGVGICDNFEELFGNSIETMKEKGLVEVYKYKEVTLTSVYVPDVTLDGYVGVQYDSLADAYYKLPYLINYSLTSNFDLLTAQGNQCVDDSATQATITSPDGPVITMTINSKDKTIVAFESLDANDEKTTVDLFYITDDRSREIVNQPALD